MTTHTAQSTAEIAIATSQSYTKNYENQLIFHRVGKVGKRNGRIFWRHVYKCIRARIVDIALLNKCYRFITVWGFTWFCFSFLAVAVHERTMWFFAATRLSFEVTQFFRSVFLLQCKKRQSTLLKAKCGKYHACVYRHEIPTLNEANKQN